MSLGYFSDSYRSILGLFANCIFFDRSSLWPFQCRDVLHPHEERPGLVRDILIDQKATVVADFDDFRRIAADGVDSLYISSDLSVETIARLLPICLEKLKDGGIICGDAFGLPSWKQLTAAIGYLLGVPDQRAEDGLWFKQYHRSNCKLFAVSTLPLSTRHECVVVTAGAGSASQLILLTLFSVRKAWDGNIEVHHAGAVEAIVAIACAIFGATLRNISTIGEWSDLLPQSRQQSCYLMLDAGVVIALPLDEPVERPYSEMSRFFEPAERNRREEIQADITRVPGSTFCLEGLRVAKLVDLSGNPSYWTEDAWTIFSDLFSELGSHLFVEVQIPNDVAVVTVVTPETVGDFQEHWITWRFPRHNPIIVLLFGGVSLWFPGDRQPDAVFSAFSEELFSYTTLCQKLLSLTSIERIILLPSCAWAKPGAELWLADWWQPFEIVQHLTCMGPTDKTSSCGPFAAIVALDLLHELPWIRLLLGTITSSEALSALNEGTKCSQVDLGHWGWEFRDVSSQRAGLDSASTTIAVAVNVYKEPILQIQQCFSLS